MCEDLNLMDQRVLAFVKVGLWLADCSPVESHPCCIVLLMLQCSSRCVVVSLRCCARVALSCWLSLAAMQCSSRCVAVSLLSSACQSRSVCCARRRCCSFASWPLLLRCCAHAPCHACSVECSSRCFVSADSRFAPCCAPACRWCPALSRGRWWLGCGCGGRAGAGGLVAPGVFPLPRGLFSVEGGGGVFLVGIKITPIRPLGLTEGVGVHSMLTNSIPGVVTVALPAAPTTSVLGRVGRGFACRAGLPP